MHPVTLVVKLPDASGESSLRLQMHPATVDLKSPVEFYDHPVGGMGGMNTLHFGVHFQLFNQSLHSCPL